MIYLILLFTILFLILAWRQLDWAVMILIAALPSYLIRFSVLGLPSTLLEIMIWAVFIVWFIKSYSDIFENLKFKIGHSLKISCPRMGENWKLKIIARYPFDWEMVLLLLIALLAVGVAGFSSSAFGIWKAYFFEPVLLFIVVINVYGHNANAAIRQLAERMPQIKIGIEKMLWALAVSALIVSFLAIYQKITGQLIDNPLWAAAGTRRVVSFFGYPNAVGLYLGPLVLVFLGWLFDCILRDRAVIMHDERKNFQFSIFPHPGTSNFQSIFNVKIFKPAVVLLVIIMSVLSIYFAKSKGALLGVGAGLVVFGLLAGKKIRWAVIAVIIVMAAGVLAYQPARTLAYNTVTFKTLSGQIRIAGWSDTWKMLKDGRLITGAGLANFQASIAPYHTEGIFIKDPNDPNAQKKLVFNAAYRTAHWQPLEIYLYPHNIVLNFWSELGLAGVLLFVWVIIKYFWVGISNFEFRISNKDLIFNDSKFIQNSKFKINNFYYFNIGLICAMVAIVVHGLVDVPYFKNDLAVMFWLLVAMISMINLENKNFNKN